MSNYKYKICIIGHFGNGQKNFDGQTIKTISVYNELKSKYGQDAIIICDTRVMRRRPIKFFKLFKKSIQKSENIIILPARRGVKVLIPLINIIKNQNHIVHYIVIGGWIAEMTKHNRSVKNSLLKIDYIYVENSKTKEKLNAIGLNNVEIMRNFKKLKVTNNVHKITNGQLKCCIFSRIEKKKGISDAIEVVGQINKKGKNNISLDIYGKINKDYEKEFNSLLNKYNNVNYFGAIDYDKSVQAIEKYNLLLFPTKHYTEGIPGTIIDAYFSGVPVVASRWENYSDIIKEGKTGLCYDFNDKIQFKELLIDLAENKYDLKSISENCKKEAVKYSPNACMKTLYKNIGVKNANK